MPYPQFIVAMKADLSIDDVVDFINMISEQGEKKFKRLYVALPFTRLKEMTKKYPDSGITFGALLMNPAEDGSFTGPVAAKMLKDAGAQFTLVGNSDERIILKSQDSQLKEKLSLAFKEGLRPIYCIGAGKELNEDELVESLKPLSESGILASDAHPIVVYELPFIAFKSYLPSKEELDTLKQQIQSALHKAFGNEAEKVKVIASLPADLIGFSALIETLPFDGAYFTKSGIYPHAVHQETAKLFHVHCQNETKEGD